MPRERPLRDVDRGRFSIKLVINTYTFKGKALLSSEFVGSQVIDGNCNFN